MTTKPKHTRKTTANDHSLDIRRARTLVLLRPSLAALKGYRTEVVRHLNETIARLEGLERWCIGTGTLPEAFTNYARLHPLTHGSVAVVADADADADAMEELAYGPVPFAESAFENLAHFATVGSTRSLNEAAPIIAGSINDGVAPDQVHEVFDTLCSQNGVKASCSEVVGHA